MTTTDYSEAGERHRVAGQELSHLSIEVGHFYMDQIANGTVREDRIRAQFQRVAPLLRKFTEIAQEERDGRARVSTCFLVDDYFKSDTDPTRVLDKVLELAEECDVRIDYLAREAGCAEVPTFIGEEPVGEPIRLAEMMVSRLIAQPDEESNGRRPPTLEGGWLCNGRRSSDDEREQAMRVGPYRPPEEYNARNHSIFLDVQLWSTERRNGVDRTLWSCPFLASIWQLLRLGMIRNDGAVVAAPRERPARWPDHWNKMPAVMQLNPDAAPFAAYRALSLLPYHYLGIEHAVRVILAHLRPDDEVYEKLVERAARERITMPREVTQRLSHVFIGDV
ncbi:hypothetical protein JK358_02020 [Nocardia sp. 2]|uniref:Uncharacterized protein n=1 Tax=Nocardia acididurans TaxID=2802282 RepID=A0ABS1LZ06_9NOCA|nr:SCO2522 family protein [Nocardia acididurans]MBL1073165.1 hypothetical protein [Nocardia acididurans]